MNGTHATRIALAVGLLICASIVLGISADLETIVRDKGQRITSTTTFPYVAWAAATTICIEVILIIVRLLSPESLLGVVIVDMVWSMIMFICWLCASALVTIRTNACRFNFGLSSSFCSKIDATAAFLWIGWSLWLFVLFTLVYIVGSSQGDRHVLKEPIPTYEPKRHYNYNNNNAPFAPVTSNATQPGPWARQSPPTAPPPQQPQATAMNNMV